MRNYQPDLKAYTSDVARCPMLPESEIRRLIELAQDGCVDSRNKVVEANLRLVVKLAKKFQGRGLPLDELIAEGNVGLVHAVGKFQLWRNVKFISYAGWWIVQGMKKALREPPAIGPIHIPSFLLQLRRWRDGGQRWRLDKLSKRRLKLLDVADRLLSAITFSTSSRIARDGGVEEYGGQNTGHSDYTVSGTDVPDHRREQYDAELQDELDKLLNALKCMNPRDRTILQMRFGIGCDHQCTLKEVGEALGCTREWVRQVETIAMQDLRRLLKA